MTRSSLDDDSLEVSLFGPGYGECAVIHIGGNRWIVVDSCLDTETGVPVAIQYLESIGVDLARDVVAVVATHWHDDHVRGISEVVAQAESSKFFLSVAFANRELVGLAEAFAKRPLAGRHTPGVRELHSVLTHLKERSVPVTTCVADKRLLRVQGQDLPHGEDCEVWALSPSDVEVQTFFENITAQMPVGGTKRRVASLKPNDSAVAVAICFQSTAILLGSDLEEPGPADRGWSAILSSSARPSISSDVFKVPHHGGKSAHHDDVWSRLCSTEVIAMLTPFQNGGVRLPSEEDAERIRSRSSRAFASATASQRRTRKRRSKDVEKQIRETTKRLWQQPTTGHVRARKPKNGEWEIELKNGAIAL